MCKRRSPAASRRARGGGYHAPMAELDQSVGARSRLQQRFPDFYIVGHSKCGTTALYEMLRRHPQIFMPDVKEPMFFARNPDAPTFTPGAQSFEQTGTIRETEED